MSEFKDSTVGIRSEAPTLCQEFDVAGLERENEYLKLQVDLLKKELGESA